MSAVLETPPVEPLIDDLPVDRLYRLSVAQYHAMISAGILADGTRIELLDGLLVEKVGKDGSHCVTLNLVRDLLLSLIPEGWHVRLQDPVTLDTSEPEPDAVVARGAVRDYVDHHPVPDDVGLLIEVANTSLAVDRGFKRRLYARNAIKQYWIININDRAIEAYTEPTGPDEDPDYRTRRVFTSGQTVALHLDRGEAVQVAVADVLP